MQEVNLTSVYLCCKAVLPYMRAQGRGSIINTASFVAVMGAATSQISYTASKGGVLAMSRELGVQFAREGIRVNALCPGPVDTPLLRELFAKDPERAARRLVHIPMGRFADADRDRQRRAVPGQRRVELHHGVDVPRRRRHQRRLRHPALTACVRPHPPTGTQLVSMGVVVDFPPRYMPSVADVSPGQRAAAVSSSRRRMAAATTCGCSICETCPLSGSSSIRLSGKLRAAREAVRGSTSRSLSP